MAVKGNNKPKGKPNNNNNNKSSNNNAKAGSKRKLPSQTNQKANKKRKIEQKKLSQRENPPVIIEEEEQLITEEDFDFVNQNLDNLGFLQAFNPTEFELHNHKSSQVKVPRGQKKNKEKEEKEEKEEEYEKKHRSSERWEKDEQMAKLPTKDERSGKIVNSAPTPSTLLSQTKERIKEKEIRKEIEVKALQEKSEKVIKANKATAAANKLTEIDETGGKLPQFVYEALKNRNITPIELTLYMKQQKEYIATLAGHIIEDPETNYKKLHDLHILCEFNPVSFKIKKAKSNFYRKGKGKGESDEKKEIEVEDNQINKQFLKTHAKARQLAILSLSALYSDILPGYRIRQDTDDISSTRMLKKEVLKLRQHEISLLSAYQRYLMLLERFINENTPQLFFPSVKSYCQILIAKPHFNLRSSILQVLVPLMASLDPKVSKQCCDTFETLFENDDNGEVSLETVRLIAQFLKKRSFNVKSEILNTFLKLKFTEDLSLNLNGGLSRAHLTKKQKKKMTKGEKKAKKEKDEIEKELREVEAIESKETIQRNQSDILKAIFMIYFRIIKKVKTSPLIPSVLAGLAQYSHLINLDFQVDLMTSIKDLMNHPDTPIDIVARCTETVFTNIKIHGGSTLDIDLKDFYEFLYQKLLELPQHPTSLLLILNCVKLMITENREVLIPRAAAFVKRLATVSLQLPPYCILSVLTCLQRILHFHPRLHRIIEAAEDKPGTDSYQPLAQNPDHANGLFSTLWELSLLEQHYHATVSERAVATAEAKATRLQPEEIFHQFDSRSGGFNPPISKPSPHPHHKQLQKHPKHKIYLKSPDPSPFYLDLIDLSFGAENDDENEEEEVKNVLMNEWDSSIQFQTEKIEYEEEQYRSLLSQFSDFAKANEKQTTPVKNKQ